MNDYLLCRHFWLSLLFQLSILVRSSSNTRINEEIIWDELCSECLEMCFLLSLGEVKYSEVVFLCQVSDHTVIGDELWLPYCVGLKKKEIIRFINQRWRRVWSYKLIANVVKEGSDGKGESGIEEESLADTGGHIRKSS